MTLSSFTTSKTILHFSVCEVEHVDCENVERHRLTYSIHTVSNTGRTHFSYEPKTVEIDFLFE